MMNATQPAVDARNALAGNLLASIVSSDASDAPLAPLTMIVAHPDDETIGASALLPRLRGSTFIYVTDGAPRNMLDARSAGYTSCQQYSATRRDERRAVFALAGLAERFDVIDFDIPDQEVTFHLVTLAQRLADWFGARQHACVVTHPYEGGHPDHDATAFAVHAACRLVRRSHVAAPVILELTSYHSRNGQFYASEFLPGERDAVATIKLTPAQQDFKRQLLACYSSQRNTLRWFPVNRERFRPAPKYDFTRPPHVGVLFYEQFSWGMTAERFCRLAKEAEQQLGLGPS